MAINEIREPLQKRAKDKKERIIKSGFALFCREGYYNVSTPDIAKEAGVSTGIIYNYFHDKHDILIEGLRLYSENIFYPEIKTDNYDFSKNQLKETIRLIINLFIENHKLSKVAHEEIMAMVHTDKEVSEIYENCEIQLTDNLYDVLSINEYNKNKLKERIHICLGLIENICHEIIYHNHKSFDYNYMKEKTIDEIVNILIKEENM